MIKQRYLIVSNYDQSLNNNGSVAFNNFISNLRKTLTTTYFKLENLIFINGCYRPILTVVLDLKALLWHHWEHRSVCCCEEIFEKWIDLSRIKNVTKLTKYF